MSKLISILVATWLITSLSAFPEQPKGMKEDVLWETLKNGYLDPGFHFSIFSGDIKIQLSGNYNPADTVYIDQFASELSGILEKVKVYRVKAGGNLILNIQTLPDSVFEPIPKKVNSKTKAAKFKVKPKPSQREIIRAVMDSVKLEDIMTNKVALMDYYFAVIWSYYIPLKEIKAHRNENGFLANVQLKVRQSAPQIIRNKAIQYYLTRELIIPYQNKRKLYDRNDHSLLGSNLPLNSHFQEKDSFILSKAYAKDIYLQLYIRYPKLFLKSLTYRYGNYSLILYFALSILIVLVYILALFKLNRITTLSNAWKDYMKTGMLIMQSATIMYLIFKLYEGRILNEPIPAFLGETIVIPNIFNFISLNVFYFFEKLLIRENSTILQRLYIQLFLSLLPVFVLFFSFHRDTIFMSFVLAYGFIMIIGRMAYSYFNFKTLNAINEKDLEIIHFREMQHSAELQALHSRINPHFLYNSLNSIAGLARTDPEKTEKMALALSEFCRYTINKGNGTYSNVSEEAELANIYLEIEKVRFGEKLQYEYDIRDAVKDMIIPRFIIQPLIENAIKHGITQLTGQGKIKLVIDTYDNTLKIEVYDNGPAFSNTPTKGYGLQSIFDKLEILYKGKAHMNWQNEPEKFISITIPIEDKH
jgi:two-component system, LytTR family, sensor kinase